MILSKNKIGARCSRNLSSPSNQCECQKIYSFWKSPKNKPSLQNEQIDSRCTDLLTEKLNSELKVPNYFYPLCQAQSQQEINHKSEQTNAQAWARKVNKILLTAKIKGKSLTAVGWIKTWWVGVYLGPIYWTNRLVQLFPQQKAFQARILDRAFLFISLTCLRSQ